VTTSSYGSPYISGVVPESLSQYVSNGQFRTARAGFPVSIYTAYAAVNIEPEVADATVTVELDPGLSVPGTVVGPDGRELAGAVTMGLIPGITYFDQPPLDTARFEARALRKGDVRRVIVFHTEKGLAGSALITGGQKDGAVVRLGPWGEVTGRAVDESGRPAKDAYQMAITDQACFTDFDQGTSPLCPSRSATQIGPDGRFRFRGLVPGLKYRFGVFTNVPRTFQTHAMGEFEAVVKPGEVKDVGDVRLVVPKPPDEGR
jgi:hypothetical protein